MPPSDPFKNNAVGATAPPRHLFAITPSDDDDLPHVTRAIWVGAGGDLTLIAADDDAAVTLSQAPGGWCAVQARRVLATGTTALDLVGCY